MMDQYVFNVVVKVRDGLRKEDPKKTDLEYILGQLDTLIDLYSEQGPPEPQKKLKLPGWGS